MVLGNRYVTMLHGFPTDTTSGEVIKSEDGVCFATVNLITQQNETVSHCNRRKSKTLNQK